MPDTNRRGTLKLGGIRGDQHHVTRVLNDCLGDLHPAKVEVV